MPNYRRYYAEGGTYFFTVNLLDRRQDLLTKHIDKLRDAYAYVQARRPFRTWAMAVLPDHFHCLWQLLLQDRDFTTRIRLLKAFFSRSLPRDEVSTQSRKRRGERGIWQRRFWEHLIRDERDFEAHLGYIYNNPVKHGYVSKPEDWPYSSMHRDLAQFAALIAPYTTGATFGERV